MDKINITVSNPTYPKAKKLTKEDVWGEYSHEDGKRISRTVRRRETSK